MNIIEFIPHRGPMLLVDKIVTLDLQANTIETIKRVRGDEFFLQGHYPDFKIVPGIITCEMIFQSGAALIHAMLGQTTHDMSDSIPVISRTNNTRLKIMILPEDEVQINVKFVERVAGAFYMMGRASVGGKLAASVEFTAMLAPKPKSKI